MQKMILRWTSCGHVIEFPRPLCGGECCLCATCHPNPVHVSPGKCRRCDVKRSRMAEGAAVLREGRCPTSARRQRHELLRGEGVGQTPSLMVSRTSLLPLNRKHIINLAHDPLGPLHGGGVYFRQVCATRVVFPIKGDQ